MDLKLVGLLYWKHCFYKYNELNISNPSVNFLGPTFQLYPGSDHILPLPPLSLRNSSPNNLDGCNIFWTTISSSSLMLLQSIFKTSGTKWPWKCKSKYNMLPPISHRVEAKVPVTFLASSLPTYNLAAFTSAIGYCNGQGKFLPQDLWNILFLLPMMLYPI